MVNLTDNEAQCIRDRIEDALKNISRRGFTGKVYEMLWGDRHNANFHATYFKCYWSKYPNRFFEIGFLKQNDSDSLVVNNTKFEINVNKAQKFEYDASDFQSIIEDIYDMYKVVEAPVKKAPVSEAPDSEAPVSDGLDIKAHFWLAISKLADHVALLQERLSL